MIRFAWFENFRKESGTSLTEFVMFLPVFIVIFAGIVNLGKFGYETTRTNILAQNKLWANVIPLTDGYASGGVHMSSVAGNGEAATHMLGLAAEPDNDQVAGDLYEAGVMGLGAAKGHWGESYGRVKPFAATSLANGVDPTSDPGDIIGDQPFPNAIMNDGLDREAPSGVLEILVAALAGSGAIPALAAGIRYGEVYGEESRSFSVGNVGSFSAANHFDILVAPSPRKGFLPNKSTYAWAWVMAQTDKNYRVMMTFGEKGWEGDSSGGSSRLDGYLDKMDEELGKKDDAVQDAEDQKAEEDAAAAEGGG